MRGDRLRPLARRCGPTWTRAKQAAHPLSITITPDPSDDPEFIRLIETIVRRLDDQLEPEEVFVIEIRNWFDHKWLNFSGKGRVPFDSPFARHPGVALDVFYQDKLTFPPFTPKRILNYDRWTYETGATRTRFVHPPRLEHSASNLQRRVTEFAHSALFVWFSSATRTNDRGSLMVYQVDGDRVDTWYASIRKSTGWRLERAKGITIECANALAEPHAEEGGPVLSSA